MNGAKFIDVLFWMIQEECFVQDDLEEAFGFNEERAQQLITAFAGMGVLDTAPMNPMIKCKITDPDTLKANHLLVDALHGMGITDSELLALFENKGLSSAILRMPHDWRSCAEEAVPLDTPVLCRLYGATNQIDSPIHEDMKIATFDGKNWSILPPFPKYDYSILSDHERLKTGVVITHWAPANEDTMDAWNHRFDPIGTCNFLSLKVDKAHDELVYRALMYGSACMAMVYGERLVHPETEEDELVRTLHDVLIDLQYTMDRASSSDAEGGKPTPEQTVSSR